jgi:DNA-binding CsgD family transcriptional regulator
MWRADSDQPAVVQAARQPAPFVGRDREVDYLTTRLVRAASGEGGAILVSGEPGVGKTRLITEFASRAGNSGWLVLTGSAYETEGMPPYLPFAEALRVYLRAMPAEQLESTIGPSRAELAIIMPELRHAFGNLGSEGTTGDTDRFQLFERISSFLLDLSQSSELRGLLLCLDDLHWADPSTLLLLQHLARRLRSKRILVAGAYRTEEVDPARPFFSLLADFTRERLDERLVLKPLTLQQTADLLRRTGFSLDEAVVEAVYRQTQGNPFYLEEVLRELRDKDDGALEGGELAIPEGVREVIGKRLLRLRPEAQRLMQAGAVLGDSFQFEIAVAMSDLDEHMLMDALDQALSAGLLREQGEICRFGHPLIQRTIYDSLSAARRRALHLRAARAIEANYGRYLEPYLSPLAVNYRLSGSRADPEKTIECSVLAGAAAEKALAYEEACGHWQAALGLMERYKVDPSRRADLLARMGDLMQVVGFDSYAEGVRCFKQAIALHEQINEREKAAEVQARLGLLLAAGWSGQDNDAALRYLRAAEEILKDGTPSEAQLWLYSGLGLVSVWQVSPHHGLPSSRRAIQLALKVGRQDRWVTNAVMCGYHLHALGKLEEGFHLLQRAWEKADEIDQTYPAFVAASWLAGRLRELGDPITAAEWCEREVGQRRQDEAPSRRRALWSQLASLKAAAGNLEMSSALQARERVPPGPDTALYLGDWDAAVAGWERGRKASISSGNLSQLAGTNLQLTRPCGLRGETDRPQSLLEEALRIGMGGPHMIVQLRASADLAILRLQAGERETAEEHLQRCRHILAGGEDWRGLAGRFNLAEALACAADGDLQTGERRLAEALATFGQYSLRWEEAETWTAWGEAQARAGRYHSHEAQQSFEKALAIYESIGAPPRWIQAVEARLQRSLGPRSVEPAPALPDGLTQREVDVLKLIAGGHSNREIADTLVISLRTVERHITNVYTKIGARGRADATAYVLHRFPS